MFGVSIFSLNFKAKKFRLFYNSYAFIGLDEITLQEIYFSGTLNNVWMKYLLKSYLYYCLGKEAKPLYWFIKSKCFLSTITCETKYKYFLNYYLSFISSTSYILNFQIYTIITHTCTCTNNNKFHSHKLFSLTTGSLKRELER